MAMSGEVKVDLERVGQHPEPRAQRGQGGGRLRRDRVPQHPHAVGQDQLLGQAHEEAPDPQVKALERLAPVVDLAHDVHIAHDRPGDELREHRHVAAEGDRVALRRAVAAVDVDGVGHGLERVEGDAHRQRHARHRDGERERRVERGDDQPRILEEAEQREVDRDRRNEQRPPHARPAVKLFHQQAVAVVHDRGKEHQHDVDRLAPGVEDQARKKQQQVPKPPRHREIEQDRQRQKERQKAQARKDHARPPFPFFLEIRSGTAPLPIGFPAVRLRPQPPPRPGSR